MSDLELVMARLGGLVGGDLPMHCLALVHQGRPIPAERVRFNPKQQRFFKGGRSRAAGDAFMYSFRVAMNRRPPLADTVAICCLFYLADRRPMDVDNLMKLVMDAATRAQVWRDDRQVIAQASFLELDPEHPRTLVAICPYVGTLTKAPLLGGDLALKGGSV